MSATREQIVFGADELRRAAVLAGREQTTHQGKLRIVRETMQIAAFVRDTHRWPQFRLKGDPAENRLALCLHRLVVRLACHDGYGAPADPMEIAKAEEQARRRARAERHEAPVDRRGPLRREAPSAHPRA